MKNGIITISIIGLLAIIFLLTTSFMPRKVIYATNPQDETSIHLQQEILDRLQVSPPCPQGEIDLSKLTSYKISLVGNTGSMKPTLNENSKLLVDQEGEYPISVGDIICYKNGDGWWVHRIIGETADCWLCQGDNNRFYNQIEYVPKTTEIVRVMGILY